MRLVKTKVKENKSEIIKVYISELEHCVTFAYLFCMLGIFPLYYKEQYSKIGTVKFEFFWKTSLYFIGISLLVLLVKVILQRVLMNTCNKIQNINKVKTEKKSQESVHDLKTDKKVFDNPILIFLDRLSFLDYAVLIYAVCVLLSYAFSDFKYYALKGAAGWEMGLCSQMIFVAIYFILSGKKEWFLKGKVRTAERNYGLFAKIILGVHLISSALTFLFGILHRFEIDPLGMYEGLNLNQKIEFLSTIGQATWFSSYVCTVFTIGIILFYISEKRWIRIVSGIYSGISFGILVTQNSDSAFMAIGGIMLLLGYYSLSDIKKWYRFWQIMCLMWGIFAGIGILQKVFSYRAIPLDTLSIFFSQSPVTWVMFAVSLVLLLFYQNYYKKELMKKFITDGKIKPGRGNNYKNGTEKKVLINRKKNAECKKDNYERNRDIEEAGSDRIMKITKKIYLVILFLLAAAVVITLIFIYLNTKGFLLDRFGYQSTNEYLLFDYHWGSNRGSTWIVCWEAFCSLPLFQKLFGVGPDSLSAYLYSVPEISDFLHDLWGSVRLTNAHNEYLNSLLCYGLVGVAAWLSVLIGGISYFYKKAKDNPFMMAFALCIGGYACHNIFCYQQVCCTPFLFIALGIGESLTKSENFNTIK